MTTYQIGVHVFGGPTGTRVGIIRRDGQIQIFETREAAQLETDRLTQAKHDDPHSGAHGARYRYWVQDNLGNEIYPPSARADVEQLPPMAPFTG